MALRRTNSPSNTEPTRNFPGYLVEVVSKTPFTSIGGPPFCVWQFRIRLASDNQPNNAIAFSPFVASAGTGTGTGAFGLAFSSRIDIKLPKLYPECQAVQGTSVLRVPQDARQYVAIHFGAVANASDHIDLFFLAPCEEDPSTPVHLVAEWTEGGKWNEIPFRVADQPMPHTTQIIRGPAIAATTSDCPPRPDPSPSPPSPDPVPPGDNPKNHSRELKNSKRLMYSASYVTTQFTPDEQKKVESQPGGGAAKANLMRALSLAPPEIERMQAALNSPKFHRGSDEQDKLFAIARRLFSTHQMSTVELASDLAPLSYNALTQFAELSSTIKEVPAYTKILFELSNRRRMISPIGRIHLERIEMYPAGVQKGELVFTVPMAPGETVSISHKEWSTSTREFEDIVQDFFESYSERGVAEKSDVSMSSESEAKHSSAINFGASLSGSYAGVTLTTTLGITNTNDERESVKQSMQKSREVTEKASARTRKEHKVSVKLETKTGNEDHSAKTITNTSATPVRIDYYRMMRKWRTDLFRYGLRATYDIAIPLPGVRLWALHQRVAELEQAMRVPFVFTHTPDELTDSNWIAKAMEVGASDVPPPPAAQLQATPSAIIDYTPQDQSGITRFGKVDFDVPSGYWLESAEATATVARWPTWAWQWLNGHNTGYVTGPDSGVYKGDLFDYRFRSGSMSANYGYRGISFATLTLMLTFGRTPSALKAWQHTAWVAIKAAAFARHQEKLARAQEERDRLWRLLNGKDTLSLRRLEREELMRLVMSWLLGPDSRLKPGGVEPDGIGPPVTPPVQSTVGLMLKNEHDFVFAATSSISPTFTGVVELAAYDAILFGEFVKFMHQAVEWENILYFLYPYFWGSEIVGRDKLLFEHPDPEHERFLRAGYARIVLPIRPGFEEDFTALVETGTLAGHLTSPYTPIAQEIANFARTNYAGIPPANPELHARPLLFPEQRATWDVMQELMKTIDDFKAKNGHYPAKLTDLAAPPSDAWGNPFVYRVPGLGADYDLVSLGADNKEGGEGLDADISSAAGASLVATWFEYTPTSALDIEMDTKAEDIA